MTAMLIRGLISIAFGFLVGQTARAEPPSQTALAKAMHEILDAPQYKHAKWGVMVVDAKSGETVFSQNADSLFTPASVTKLFSGASALITLGPDSKIETPVYRIGEVKEGVLNGNLILVGKGDLTFGGRTTAEGKVVWDDDDHTYANGNLNGKLTVGTNPLAALDNLAKQVKQSGIVRIDGDVLVDDRYFEKTRGSGSGPDAVTPILVNDNIIDVVITPGEKPGMPAKITRIPETEYQRGDHDVTTGNAGSSTKLSVLFGGPNHYLVRGTIAVDQAPVVRIIPVDEPPLFARGLFIEALRRAGVRVEAAVQKPENVILPEEKRYSAETKVASVESVPFRDAFKVTLKVSHNLYASTFPCLVAANKGFKQLSSGMREQRKVLKSLGVDTDALSFGGGAGGAWADCVTPRATTQLLAGMRKRPEWPAYLDALPILGVDGTLASVVDAKSPAHGKVFAKTGTLSYTDSFNGRSLLRSKALAGVMTTQAGVELNFAMFVNNVSLPSGVTASREGKQLGKLCEILYLNVK